MSVKENDLIEERGYRDVTYAELAQIVYDHPDQYVDFTFETAEEAEVWRGPTGWHGVRLVNLFDCEFGTVIIAYYGGYGHFSMSLLDYAKADETCDIYCGMQDNKKSVGYIAKALRHYAESTEGWVYETVCTDWKEDEEKYGS